MQGIKYVVDMVLCIDGTGSMGYIIGEVKERALRFYQDLQEHLDRKNKKIQTLRIKVIVFRDYYVDGAQSMQISPFFAIPDEQEAFANFVKSIVADGGGDDPESGLEALALAMSSEWSKSGNKRRQIIVIWTDAPSHPLEKNAQNKPENYPFDMPKNFSELGSMWEGQKYMSHSAKRLILFAPDVSPWTEISDFWTNVIHHRAKAGNGLSDIDYNTILEVIANSV